MEFYDFNGDFILEFIFEKKHDIFYIISIKTDEIQTMMRNKVF